MVRKRLNYFETETPECCKAETWGEVDKLLVIDFSTVRIFVGDIAQAYISTFRHQHAGL